MIITINGLDKSLRKFSDLEIATALSTGIKKSVFALSGTAKKETPVGATGFLRNSFRERFSGLKGTLVNVSLYAPFVHEGRKPGKMPPLAPISLWVKRKGIDIPAFVIARSIAKKGTKANPFLKRTAEHEEENVRQIMQGEIRQLINNTFR